MLCSTLPFRSALISVNPRLNLRSRSRYPKGYSLQNARPACSKPNPGGILVVMSVTRCSTCGAELIPEANFCRQCGATVTSVRAANASEEPTLTLKERVDDVTTQRLDPRVTSRGRGPLRNPIGDSLAAASVHGHAPPSRRKVRRALLAGSVVLVVIIAIISSVAFVRIRSHSRTTDSGALMYPGAQTVVDITSDDGRAIQMQTGDSLDRVVKWYEGSLKPTKTMRLTSTTFVLKNQHVTATIVTEENKTNILIKQSLTP
jgi:hypothetical protein